MSANWPVVLEHRRHTLAALVKARQHAIYAGDRPVVDYLRSAIARQRERVDYAARIVRRGDRVFTLVGARFAASDNRPDNGVRTGADNGR
ncbi:MAG: hypothetical protein ABIQ36_01085 [Rhodanobacter sp.]